jgi:hypothetical protein
LSSAEKAAALQDFRQEANLLVPLSHPNLPNVSDIFEEAGKAYLVMEFIEGKTLETIQEEANGPLDEHQVLDWALQLCNVLLYLHSQPQQIIFRDMKPSNVMITKNGQVKLIDFGIARIFKSSSTKDTTSLGSRGYAPLEQYGRGQSDPRSDVYALGATLYDLLTFATPPDAVTRQLNPTALIRLRQLNPRVSQVVEEIVLKAMEMDPAKRFQTIEAMYQAIMNTGLIQQSSSMQMPTIPPAPPSTLVGQVQPPVQAQPAKGLSRRGLLIGAGLIAVAGIGGYSYYRTTTGGKAPVGSNTVGVSSGESIAVDFYCSTEKQAWMGAAADTFNANNVVRQGKVIQINLRYGGSLALVNNILTGDALPVAWSPASSIEVDRFLTAWQKQHNNEDVVLTSEQKPLVQSPLVFAVWNTYADLLLRKYSKIDWPSIAEALKLPDGWKSIDAAQPQGNINFAQTSPNESNSGLLTIILMAYAFYHREQGNLSVADIKNTAFLNYLSLFENAVNAFGRSSGTYLQNEILVKGPATYNITATYENLVLTAQEDVKRRYPTQRLLPFYPGINIISDHPFVLFQDKTISSQAQDGARAFRDFLLARPQQQMALHYGLRPVSADVHINDAVPNNAFLQPDLQKYISNDYLPVPHPRRDVIEELLNQWLASYKDSTLATG